MHCDPAVEALFPESVELGKAIYTVKAASFSWCCGDAHYQARIRISGYRSEPEVKGPPPVGFDRSESDLIGPNSATHFNVLSTTTLFVLRCGFSARLFPTSKVHVYDSPRAGHAVEHAKWGLALPKLGDTGHLS